MSGKIKVVLVGFLLMMATPLSAMAANAFSTGNVNMRSGPGTSYAQITTIPSGSTLTMHGCLNGYNWCDVSWSGRRGWVSSNYLQALYRNQRHPLVYAGPRIRIPIVTFHRPRPPVWHTGRPKPPHWHKPGHRPPHWQKPSRPKPPHHGRPRPPRPQPRT
jgi:uncharacterized protein YraI